MAVVHVSASIRPTKPELLEATLGGPVEVLGSYRFDDPEGEVGVEAFLVRRGPDLKHVVYTYRDAVLAADDAHLVATMQHSVLGPRWVYDGATDPVALDCFQRALRGELDQAVLEVWRDGQPAGTREPSVRLSTRPGGPGGPDDDGADGAPVRILREPVDDVPGAALVIAWDGGEAVVATAGG